MLHADYTMCYMDALVLSPDLIAGIQWDTPEHTKKLTDMIYSKFFNYEISGETIQEQKIFMTAKFNEYKDYYAELLNTYETEINWLDGIVTTASYNESGSESSSTSEVVDGSIVETPRATIESKTERGITTTTDNYDLPRTASTENRPSSREIVTPGSGSDTVTTKGKDGQNTTTNDTTTTTTKSGTSANEHTRNVKVADAIERKKKYMELLRSVYSEFADKFKPCFLTMFS